MKKITICLSYYNQSKETLIRHLNYWNNFDNNIKQYYTFQIIDDCSKIPINNLLSKDLFNDLDIKLYRVLEDKFCNISGVRNLAAQECKTEWMLILDMDTYINNYMANQLLTLLDTDMAYKFNRKTTNLNHPKNNKPHPAVCLIKKQKFWEIGGCEEDLVGNYGYTDPCFWFRAKNIIKSETKKDIYLEYFDDAEADIVRDTSNNYQIYLDKTKNNNWSNNYIRFSWKKINL